MLADDEPHVALPSPRSLALNAAIIPLERMAGKLQTQAKVVPRLFTINHSSYLRKLPLGGKNHLFARPPVLLAHHASAVRTDVFGNGLLTSAGVTRPCKVNGN